MVRALLEGRKTQTRRVLRKQPHSDLDAWHLPEVSGPDWVQEHRVAEGFDAARLPYVLGDRLWVREAWRTESRAYDDLPPSDMGGEETIIYESDADWKLNKTVGRLRQAMHMPRWASRITLTVTEIRVLRLQEISEADAIAEGAPLDASHRDGTEDGSNPHMVAVNPWTRVSPVAWYHRLWDSLNAERGYGWDANPWVVAVTFTVEQRNIDEAAR
jgi:hypothetical protein